MPGGRHRGTAIETLVIGGLILLIAALIFSMVRLGKKDYQGLALSMAGNERKRFQVLKPCPLCHSMLSKGQTVKSKVIELAGAKTRNGVKESMAHVLGCPNCWPASASHPRVCPVCKANLGQNDYVIARYFEKSVGKNRLHVLGCTICRKF